MIMHPIHSILLVNDDRLALEALKEKLEESGYAADSASDVSEAKRILSARPADIVICDNLSLHEDGVEFLEWVTDKDPRTVVVIISAWADYGMALDGVRRAQSVKEKLDAVQPVAAAAAHAEDRDELRLRMAEELERHYPGITQVRRDRKGFLILDDERRF